MVGVSIAFVITGHYIENYRKLLTEEEILKARETASDSGKHSPATQIKIFLLGLSNPLKTFQNILRLENMAAFGVRFACPLVITNA